MRRNPADVRIVRAERKDLEDVIPLFDEYREFYEAGSDHAAARTFLTERMERDLGDGRVMTTTFEDQKGKTKLTLSVEMAESEEQERTGWTQILENLAKHVASLSRTQ